MSAPQTDPEAKNANRSPRRRVVLEGTIETLSNKFPVSVKNLSCTGALIEGAAVPDAARDVILKAGPLDCFATVVWSDGRRCGVMFDEPISQAELLALHRVTPEAARQAELEAAAEWFESQGRYARM